ncbi:hypothetical protein Mal52_22430 [Symmachiella dynata]|uniref:DUF6966 domain-containing protein n=1 Tax=Symmachiella dynata TaxID=2527995 RepID=A0A517ZMT7_9PLAN|nr:hypothetical protein Mal52_22430 [Symmachiella dynata]
MTIESLLTNIANLLDAHGQTEWAQSFRRLHSDYKYDPEMTKGRIRSIYGGSGSFNDIVLHDPNGVPLIDENNELDQMRSQLFQSCR